MASIKPVKIYGQGGPNPPKVAMLVAELDLPHEIVPYGFPDLKKPEFLAINPNGRMPALYDPNTDLTIWESGAILEYLIEKYDKDQKLSFAPGSNDSYLAKQWLFYQVSGQGPYYGQAVWFKKYHHEKIPSAVERYCKEIARVTGVLEGHLAKQSTAGDGPWFVGNKFSFVDIAMFMWQYLAGKLLPDEKEWYNEDNFPHVQAWLKKMESREKVKAVLASLPH